MIINYKIKKSNNIIINKLTIVSELFKMDSCKVSCLF